MRKKIYILIPIIIIILFSICIYNHQTTVSQATENETLLNTINDTHLRNQRLAIYYMGENECVEAVAPLQTLLKIERNQKTINEILIALGKIHTDEAYQTIIEYLDDTRTTVQVGAITAISEFETSEVEEILIEKMLFGKNKKVRISAIHGLNSFYSDEVYQAKIQVLSNEQSSDLLLAILETIKNSPEDVFVNSIFQLIETSNKLNVKLKALDLLKLYNEYEGKQEIIDFLINIINSDEKIKIRKQAIFSLRFIADSQNTDFLINLLITSSNNYIISESALALGRIHDEKSIEPLFYILQNNKKVRYSIITALEGFPISDHYELIFDILEEEDDEDIILSLIDLLAATKDREVIQPILLKYATGPSSLRYMPFDAVVMEALLDFDEDVLAEEINQLLKEYPEYKDKLNIFKH